MHVTYGIQYMYEGPTRNQYQWPHWNGVVRYFQYVVHTKSHQKITYSQNNQFRLFESNGREQWRIKSRCSLFWNGMQHMVILFICLLTFRRSVSVLSSRVEELKENVGHPLEAALRHIRKCKRFWVKKVRLLFFLFFLLRYTDHRFAEYTSSLARNSFFTACPLKWIRCAVPKRRLKTTIKRCVTSQNSKDNYTERGSLKSRKWCC